MPINSYAYVSNAPTSEYDANGLEAAYYLLHPLPSPPPPRHLEVSQQVKDRICQEIVRCAGNMDCVWTNLHYARTGRMYSGDPVNPKTWNDPLLRQAENFATAASHDATGYPASWFAHYYQSISFYQYFWKPYIKPLYGRTTPVSDDAYNAGVAGLSLYFTSPAENLKWCETCSR